VGCEVRAPSLRVGFVLRQDGMGACRDHDATSSAPEVKGRQLMSLKAERPRVRRLEVSLTLNDAGCLDELARQRLLHSGDLAECIAQVPSREL
jgi:hypothetical protein